MPSHDTLLHPTPPHPTRPLPPPTTYHNGQGFAHYLLLSLLPLLRNTHHVPTILPVAQKVTGTFLFALNVKVCVCFSLLSVRLYSCFPLATAFALGAVYITLLLFAVLLFTTDQHLLSSLLLPFYCP